MKNTILHHADSGTDSSNENESQHERQSRKKKKGNTWPSYSDSHSDGSHLEHHSRRKKRYTKKKSERKETNSLHEPHAKRKVNSTESKIQDVVERNDDTNEPKDEAPAALNVISRKRTFDQFEELGSKMIKMEPDTDETEVTFEVRTECKVEYMSDDSGAANMSDNSEVSRPMFPGLTIVF